MGSSPGVEALRLASKVFDHQEQTLKEQISKLARKREEMDSSADVMDLLTQALQSDKPFDLNQDEQIKRAVLCVHRLYPHLFDRVIEGYPEGLASQEISLERIEQVGLVQAATEDLILSDVTITPLQKEDIDPLIRGLDNHTNIAAADVNQISFDVNRLYGDREQIVKIVHEILRQLSELLRTINRHSSHG